MGRCTSRYEIASRGFDPAVADMGADLDGNQNVVGLRVPTLPTTSPANRYLFVCAAKRLSRKECLRVTAIRQLVEIGVDTSVGVPPIYPVPKAVTTEDWRFADSGPVCFSLRMHARMPATIATTALTTDSFAFQWTGGAPGLVFQTATFNAKNLDINGHPDNYTLLTGYTPPWPQQALGKQVGGFGDIQGMQFPWDKPGKQAIDPVVVRGPGWLVLWASVWQTNPATRATITLPAAIPLSPAAPEEGFVSTFSAVAGAQVVYWRVGGAMVLEQVDADRRAA